MLGSGARSAGAGVPSVVAVCLAVIVGGLAISVPAEAASTSLKISSPANFGRVTAKVLTAKVQARGPRFRATLDGRDVTSRFHRHGRTLRLAKFQRRRDFRIGRNALMVEVGKPFTRSHKTTSSVFRATTRVDGRVKVWRQAPSARRSPLHLRMRTKKRVDRVRMWVNGKRVRSKVWQGADARSLVASLGAFDHVRYGRNRVTADIEYRDGKVSRTRRSFRVARDRPLAGAGPDRHLARKRKVSLSAASTRPAHAGDRVTYRWKIVSGPKRSGAKVLRPRSVRPRFTARKPGHYRLRLVAGERGSGRLGRVADEVEMTVTPTSNPMGVKVDTFAGGSGDIVIGPNTYSCPPFTWVHLVVLDGATLTPADGGSQCFNQNQTGGLQAAVNVNQRPGLSDDLVIANGLGLNSAAQDQYAPVLTNVFNAIGGTTSTSGPTLNGKMPFVQDDWSLIGHVGLSPGEAAQSLFQHAVQSGNPLTGYLQKVVTKGYQFVSPEFATLDTRAAASTPTTNVIEVGASQSGPGGSYPSKTLPGGKSQAFQLVELDPGTMKVIWNDTYVTRNANGSVNSGGIGNLAQRLSYLAGDNYFGAERSDMPPLVLLQSFGESSSEGLQAVGNNESWVNDTLPGWGQSRGPYDQDRYDYFRWCGGSDQTKSLNGYSCNPYPNDPQGLGDNETVTRAIGLIAGMSARTAAANYGMHGATESLSLVGSPHPYSDDEVSFEVGANGGRTIATLRRTNQSQWRAAAPAPSDVFDASSMWELAFAAPTPWPCSPRQPAPCTGSASDLAAAGSYVAGQLWPGQGYGSPRGAYAEHIGDKWTANIQTLDGIPYPGADAGFSEPDFDRLKAQLAGEFSKLSSVKNMFGQYQKVFATTATNGALLDMQTIGGQIISAAFRDDTTYQSRQVEVRQKDITGSVLYLAADVLDLATFDQTSAVIGVAAGAYDLYQDMTEPDDYTQTGQVPFDEPDRIRDQADLVGADLVHRYQGINDTLNHLLLIFVSDWGKLQTADTNANGYWSLDPGSDPYFDLVETSAMGAQAAFYKALMPVAYDQWFVSPSFTYTNSNQGNEYGNGEYYGDNLAMSNPGPVGYECPPGPAPFSHAPASSVNWVRYTATGSASDDQGSLWFGSVGRALKSKADPLTLGVATWSDYPDGTNLFPATDNAGAPPLDSTGKPLTEKLFQNPTTYSSNTDPDGLAMSKDEFFGMASWSSPRLQCGRPQYLGPTAP